MFYFCYRWLLLDFKRGINQVLVFYSFLTFSISSPELYQLFISFNKWSHLFRFPCFLVFRYRIFAAFFVFPFLYKCLYIGIFCSSRSTLLFLLLEVQYDDVFIIWETIWAATYVSAPNFSLFVAVAIIVLYRLVAVHLYRSFLLLFYSAEHFQAVSYAFHLFHPLPFPTKMDCLHETVFFFYHILNLMFLRIAKKEWG